MFRLWCHFGSKTRNRGVCCHLIRCISTRKIHNFVEACDQSLVDLIKSANLYPENRASSEMMKPSLKVPSVTAILKVTQSVQSKRALERWKTQMIDKMGAAAFVEYSQGLLRRGHAIHTAIQHHLLGKDIEVDEETTPYFTSVCNELSKFDDMQACEMYLSHDFLPYCGVVDCVAHYDGSGLYMIDWKTSTHKKTSVDQTFDHPLQLAAYVGLWNSNYPHQKISQAMLVMMYPDSSPCDVIKVDEKTLNMYWQRWKSRLLQYWQQEIDTRVTY